jgi:hypothetical protein
VEGMAAARPSVLRKVLVFMVLVSYEVGNGNGK